MDDFREDVGITPASAGNTIQQSQAAQLDKDHPRIRGEYDFYKSVGLGLHGSPPHPRGIPTGGRIRAHTARITPASAGNT